VVSSWSISKRHRLCSDCRMSSLLSQGDFPRQYRSTLPLDVLVERSRVALRNPAPGRPDDLCAITRANAVIVSLNAIGMESARPEADPSSRSGIHGLDRGIRCKGRLPAANAHFGSPPALTGSGLHPAWISSRIPGGWGGGISGNVRLVWERPARKGKVAS